MKPLPSGRRTSTGSREIEVTVTRGPTGKPQTVDRVTGHAKKITAVGRGHTSNRVDKRLRWGEQTNGWWFIPEQAGGTRWWVRQENRPTTIRGYTYRPGPSWPLDHRGIQMASVVPHDVWQAAHKFNRSIDPSTRVEQFRARRGRVENGQPPKHIKIRRPATGKRPR